MRRSRDIPPQQSGAGPVIIKVSNLNKINVLFQEAIRVSRVQVSLQNKSQVYGVSCARVRTSAHEMSFRIAKPGMDATRMSRGGLAFTLTLCAAR